MARDDNMKRRDDDVDLMRDLEDEQLEDLQRTMSDSDEDSTHERRQNEQ